MGRKRKWDEDMVARFPAGTLGKMDSVLEAGEARTDLVWAAVDREIKRRERKLRLSELAEYPNDVPWPGYPVCYPRQPSHWMPLPAAPTHNPEKEE